MNKSTKIVLVVIVIVVILLLAVGVAVHYQVRNGPVAWQTYTESDFSFQVSYPPAWVLSDQLTAKTCCLFLSAVTVSTTTAPAVASTSGAATSTTTVTAHERVKLQFGYYNKKVSDPFQEASTTQVSIGGTRFYSGVANGVTFYLLPRNDTEGVGVAVFPDSAVETAADKADAEKVISSIKLFAPAATSTAGTAPATTK